MEIILKYFNNLTEKQINRFSQLYELYSEWNSKINVISRKDIENLYLNHVLHSLSIAKLISFAPGSKIMDAGTGGGFPGIPLSIMFPETEFLLIDSIGKKIKVVDAISKALNLKNIKTINGRVEKVNEKFDFVISRAVTNLPLFYSWVENKIKKELINTLKNGILYLKGGDITKEINALPTKKCFEYPLSIWFNEEYFREKMIIHIVP